MSNKEIAQVFKLLARIMEIHEENPFKTRSYHNAAFNIERLEQPLSDMQTSEIDEIKGIGPAISKKIRQILETGELDLLSHYIEQTPPGILEMLNLKGIGGKKIGNLWRALEIENISDLQEACRQGRISKLKGFGKKTEANIAQSVEYYLRHKSKFLYAQIEEEATHILKLLIEKTGSKKISFTGPLRRKSIILDGIDLIMASDENGMEEILMREEYMDLEKDDEVLKGHTSFGTPVTIHLVPENSYADRLFLTTGSDKHLDLLPVQLSNAKNEEEIYKKAGVSFIPPEWREGGMEIQWAREGKLKDLIGQNDIKGVVHAHSTYSDGTAGLRTMAEASRELGYEYLAISDHSKSAFYANGLLPEQIRKQHGEIDQLNEEMAPFRIFKGIESDILNDGELDYEENILRSFDLVIASIHSNLKMNREKAMQRLLNAIKNPYTTILGHVTSRLLLSREGYPVDHKTLIDACAEYNVVIELNANPHRLDMDWKWIPYAEEKGVMISVNPDAHSKEGILDIHYGLCAARKGGLTRDNTLNAMGVDQFASFLSKTRSSP